MLWNKWEIMSYRHTIYFKFYNQTLVKYFATYL